MNVKLSERMTALASLIPEGGRLADVGCDHAYIPIFLCQTGKIPSAIAMDVKPGPLARAKEHIYKSGWDDRIETRLSDGLEKLGEDEADTVLIAGMGGVLMRRLLSEYGIPSGVTALILQPQSEVPEVRRFVRDLGFHIADEDMVLEYGKFYPMMKAERGRIPEKENSVQEMEDLCGPVLLAERHPVLFQWLEKELAVTNDILEHLKKESNHDGTDSFASAERQSERRCEMRHRRELLLSAFDFYQ